MVPGAWDRSTSTAVQVRSVVTSVKERSELPETDLDSEGHSRESSSSPVPDHVTDAEIDPLTSLSTRLADTSSGNSKYPGYERMSGTPGDAELLVPCA